MSHFARNREQTLIQTNTKMRVSRFPTVERLLDLPPDLASRLQAIQDKAGFVPNIFLALGHRPAQLRHFMDSHDEIMAERGSLTKVDEELVVVAIAELLLPF
jgi:alkylhydroperoxidase family enzyme